MDTGAVEPETEILGVHDCWKYLQSTPVCRIAFPHRDTVEILPVNFVPSNGTVLIRTGEGTTLDSLPNGQAVSLEADGFNQYGTIAWSVVVKGHAEAADDAASHREASDSRLSPWQAGTKDRLIRVNPAEVTGRRFVIAPPSRWAPQEPSGER
ncbi:pyridoxamine 5'-phosphate oxidase family protein [Pseudarthrobacter sp. 1G09]|uniref:pyridoxamine 5'-phosphate oxidase family protein n=1 Tax=Pseudarthrobacter sp. 1G09 TaxID=3416178 RepID=UPI003CF7E43A